MKIKNHAERFDVIYWTPQMSSDNQLEVQAPRLSNGRMSTTMSSGTSPLSGP